MPIIVSVYHLYRLFHESLTQFPKSERYSLGVTCQQYMLELLQLCLRAAASNQSDQKVVYLKEASVRLDSIRLLLCLCKDCRCFANQTYQQHDAACAEIGRMLGGWLKALAGSP